MVMKYGLLRPVTNEVLVREQMRLQHQYRNTLVEIERGRRDAIRAVLGSIGSTPQMKEAADLAGEIAEAEADKVKAYKVEHRTKKVPESMRQALDAARVAKREASDAWKAAKQEARTEEVQIEIDRINALGNELVRSAYKFSRCYTWTKVKVTAPAMDAVRARPYWGVKRKGVVFPLEVNNPRFIRWTGESQIGVQIQKSQPLPCSLISTSDTRLQIHGNLLRMRIGSEGVMPVWAEWPIKMHRPLPEGMITGATVSLRKVGPREEWTAEIYVDNEPIIRPSGYGTVAVNIGWRKVDGGIRVAYAVDDEGNVDELIVRDENLRGDKQRPKNTQRPAGRLSDDERAVVREDSRLYSKACQAMDDGGSIEEAESILRGRPDLIQKLRDRVRLPPKAEVLASFRKVDELQSIRDTRFNRARYALQVWMDEHEADVPSWLRQRTRTIHAWKAPGRLAALVLFWKKNRFDDDYDAYDALERWRYRDHHLWTWASDQHKKALRRRRDIYRRWAAKLAERYHTIVVHKQDLSKAARKPRLLQKDDVEDNETARANRHLVAPSELRLSLANAKRTRDGATVQIPAAPITKTCNSCGSLESFDAADQIYHTCSSCGTRWDQDENAARNMLRLYFERPSDAAILGTARKVEKLDDNGQPTETKRARIARLVKEKAERADRFETARNSGCNPAEACAD